MTVDSRGGLPDELALVDMSLGLVGNDERLDEQRSAICGKFVRTIKMGSHDDSRELSLAWRELRSAGG